MPRPLKIVNDGGTFYVMDGDHGHPLGSSLAEARATIIEHMRDDRRDLIRALVRRLAAAGVNPRTATLAQLRAAVEASDVDV